jgi:hypothetical protein
LRAVRFYTDPANRKETPRIAADFTKLPASAFEGCKIDAKSYVDLSVVEEADERA